MDKLHAERRCAPCYRYARQAATRVATAAAARRASPCYAHDRRGVNTFRPRRHSSSPRRKEDR